MKKENSKKRIIILISIIVILLLIGGIVGYKSFISKPDKLFKSAISIGYEKISDSIKTMESNTLEYSLEDSFLIDGNLTFDTNIDEIKEYAKYNYGFRLGLDYKNEQLEMGLTLDEEEQRLIDGFIYILGDKIYYESEKLFDKLVYTQADSNFFEEVGLSTSSEVKINYDDLDKLLERIATHFSNSFSSEDFTQEKDTIKFNNEDIKVTKNTFILNSASAFKIYLNFLNSLKSDDVAISLMAKISNQDIDDIKEALDEVDESENPYEDMEEYKISIYTKGFFNQVIGGNIEYDKKEVLSYVNYDYLSVFNFNYDNLEIVVNSISTVSEGVINYEDEEVLTFRIDNFIGEKKIINEIEVNFELDNINSNIILKNKKVIEDEKNEEILFDVDARFESGGEELIVGGRLNVHTKMGAQLTDVDTNSAVDANTLTEADNTIVMNNFNNILGQTAFANLKDGLESIMQNFYYNMDQFDETIKDVETNSAIQAAQSFN